MVEQDENTTVDAKLAQKWTRFRDHPEMHFGYKQNAMRGIILSASIMLSSDKDFASRDELIKYRLEENIPKVIKVMGNEPAVGVPAEVKELSSPDGLEISVEKITSAPDGNSVPVCIVRPEKQQGPLPCVMYIHGGGMAIGSIMQPEYQAFLRVLAKQGVVVVAPEFRNSTVPTAHNPETAPFPAGLNDCFSTLKWVHANKSKLNIDDRIVVAGESGGGNLTLSLTIKCIREGQRELIAHGIYPICPYIAGNWSQDEKNSGILGTSHLDEVNNSIFLTLPTNETAALEYGIEAYRRKDALAWPAFASEEDLRQFPRVAMHVNELDPLRDEALLFFRRLLRANVRATCKQLMATPHGAEIMSTFLPEVTIDACASLAIFAKVRLPPLAAL